MGIAFDYAPDRPQYISDILAGLERYNPETTATFQEYVSQQCEDRTYDCYANLALLKLCVYTFLTSTYRKIEVSMMFNQRFLLPDRTKEKIIMNRIFGVLKSTY